MNQDGGFTCSLGYFDREDRRIVALDEERPQRQARPTASSSDFMIRSRCPERNPSWHDPQPNGWRNNEYGTNDNVPNFAPYLAARKGGTMNMTWCAVSAANREEATFDCDASSMLDAKRLCFCAPAE